jgi:hypothetical protein
MQGNSFVPRSEVSYLFPLYRVQKEGLSNTITRYRKENLSDDSGSFVKWDILGGNQVEENVAVTWNPPNCLRSESSESFLKK